MREIKYRAKTYEDRFYPDLAPSKWVFGFLVMFPNEFAWMHTSPNNQVDVQTKTIGQFTGFRDKNGKEIYEGDIVANDFGNDNIVNMTVEWCSDGYWALREIEGDDTMHFVADYLNEITIMGNVFDNPELLE